MIEQLWDMYESAVAQEYNLQQQDEFYLNTIERSTQNGVTNGILRSIELLENNKEKTFKRAFDIYCKVRGQDVKTKFGFWEKASKKPSKDGWYLVTIDGEICGSENFVGMSPFENGEWNKDEPDENVIAWMPLPEVYEDE